MMFCKSHNFKQLLYVCVCSCIDLQQNSFNPTSMWLNRCQINIQWGLPDSICTDLSYYRQLFITAAVIHWIFSFSHVFWGISVPFLYILSLFFLPGMLMDKEILNHSWRSSWRRRQGVRRYHRGWCTDILAGHFGGLPDLGLFPKTAEVSGFL